MLKEFSSLNDFSYKKCVCYLISVLTISFCLATDNSPNVSNSFLGENIRITTSKTTTLEEYRQFYQDLQQLLSQPHPDPIKVQQSLNHLQGYILYPLAKYRWLIKKPKLALQEIKTLQGILPSFISVTNLKQRWLQQQKDEKNWQLIVKEEKFLPKSTSVQCLIMYAKEIDNVEQRIKKLQPSTVKQLNKLWLTGGSLPSNCDPLLEKWRQEHYLTSNLVLARGELAFKANNRSLLRYLVKQAKDVVIQKQLNHYLRLRENPAIILNKQDSLSISRLIKHQGIGKMMVMTIFPSFVRQLPIDTLPKGFSFETLHYWEKALKLSNAEITQWHTLLVKHFFNTTNPKIKQWRDQQLIILKNDSLIERRIRLALRKGQAILPWLYRLSPTAQQKQEWQFWMGYAKNKDKQTGKAHKIWQRLAKERGFYPMLSAEMLGETYLPPMLYFKAPKYAFTDKITRSLALISELRAMKEEYFAILAWYALFYGKSQEEKLALTHYASEHKWFELQVDGTIQARAWGHLSLRLPMAYRDWFNLYLEGKDISDTFAMAIARQESGWRARVKSHANAYGVMQLLPSTAKQTAQRQNLPYTNAKQLFEPQQNIMLGVSLLQELYSKYGNNRILIAAAYNAGPSRVDSWLNQTKGKLDLAKFIATIPYRETRRYVENVLLYDYFYQVLQQKDLMKFSQEEVSRIY